MGSRIEDYALIGDCQTAALVGKDGSIDWLCFPRFDSGACFAALLGTRENGRWRIGPSGDVKRVTRRYRDGSLVLETTFETDEGIARLIDFMPIRNSSADLIRIVEGVKGRVSMELDLVLRFDYGSIVPWVQRLPEGNGIRATAGPDTVYCRAPVPLKGHGPATVAQFDVAEGDRVPFTLVWKQTHKPMPPPPDAEEQLRECENWWRDWSGRCTYQGRARDAVIRSLITLKALTYEPTGGIVAAATASLPEHIGGVRNWDYRYCWLRDATFTLLAMNVGGYLDEAGAWRTWLSNAVAGSPRDMQVLYSVLGERRIPEWEVSWLDGYEGSKPVRIGNAAVEQVQLDIYGEVIDALHQARKLGLPGEDHTWPLQRALVRHLEHRWREPDQGIWETRGPPMHFTHSKVMAWVAFDRAVKTIEQFSESGDLAAWRQTRDEIHAQVCAEAFDAQLGSFVQHYGSKEVDASLLLLPLVGFLPAKDPRIVGTVDRIQKTLLKDGFVLRNRNRPDLDGLPAGEGTFLICSFWLADCLAMIGRQADAEELFDRLVALTNDVGLLAEEYDPGAKRMLGNFPQAFSHVGLITTAANLCAAKDAPAKHRPHN